MTKVLNRIFWLTLVALALSENKRNIRSSLLCYTNIHAYAHILSVKVHISTYSGAHRFFTSHLCTFAFRSWENADTKASRFVATTKDFDISFASLPLHLYMSPSYLRTFALSSSQLRIFPFTTLYSCIFNPEEKVQVALSEHRNVSVFTLDKTRFKIHSTANMIL